MKYLVRAEPLGQGEEWRLLASHITLLDARLIEGTVSAIRKVAVSFGGRYDRWEARSLK